MPQVFKVGSYWVYFWANENDPLEQMCIRDRRMLEEQIPQKEQRLAQLQAREANVDAFIEKAKQYTAIDTLTPEAVPDVALSAGSVPPAYAARPCNRQRASGTARRSRAREHCPHRAV